MGAALEPAQDAAPLAGKADAQPTAIDASRRGQEKVERALALLCEARELLKQADHQQTLKRVRHAISSCKGAVRIAGYRVTRAHMAAEPLGAPRAGTS